MKKFSRGKTLLEHPIYSADDVVYSAISDDIEDLVHLRELMCRSMTHNLNMTFSRYGEVMSIGRIDNLVGALVVVQEWYGKREEG